MPTCVSRCAPWGSGSDSAWKRISSFLSFLVGCRKKIKSLIWAQNQLLLLLNFAKYWEGFTKLCYTINMAAAFSMTPWKEKPVTFEPFMINIVQRIPKSRGLAKESICKTVKKSLKALQHLKFWNLITFNNFSATAGFLIHLFTMHVQLKMWATA